MATGRQRLQRAARDVPDHSARRFGQPRNFDAGRHFRLTSLMASSAHRSGVLPCSGPDRLAPQGGPRRFPVDVEEFEPEVLDCPQEAVQGRLVGPGG